jgi:hypothetical protein
VLQVGRNDSVEPAASIVRVGINGVKIRQFMKHAIKIRTVSRNEEVAGRTCVFTERHKSDDSNFKALKTSRLFWIVGGNTLTALLQR